jgi:hypothetical protein
LPRNNGILAIQPTNAVEPEPVREFGLHDDHAVMTGAKLSVLRNGYRKGLSNYDAIYDRREHGIALGDVILLGGSPFDKALGRQGWPLRSRGVG